MAYYGTLDGALAANDALEAATYAQLPQTARVVNLPTPTVIAHKGGAFLAPEETLEGYRAAQAYGAQAIDLDANILADGKALAVMHDSTADRTTTGAGNLSDMLPATVQNLTVDAGAWFGGGWGNLKVPLLSQVFNEFGNQVAIVTESKTPGAAAAALAAKVAQFGLQQSVIVSTSFWADIPTLVASGAHTQFVMTTGTEKTPAAIAAAGCKSVAVDYTAAAMDAARIAAFHAAGLAVWGFIINRHVEAAAWLAKGGDGWYSDDPIYSNGPQTGYDYRLAKLAFAAQTYYHGHQAGAAGLRGAFSGGGWGFDDTTSAGARTVLAGGVSPIKGNPGADTFTIDWTCAVTSQTDTGRWVGGFICAADDKAWNDNGAGVGVNGYRWLVSGAGTMQLLRYTNGATDATLVNQATAALTLPATISGQIIVTPTSITVKRTDAGGAASATVAAPGQAAAATYRGGYSHLAMSGTTGRFTRYEITA